MSSLLDLYSLQKLLRMAFRVHRASVALPFQTYTNLLKNCCSLTKVLRVLATKCFMDNILAGIYSTKQTDISLKLPQVAVLLQPGMMQRLRQFKPTEANLKDAFF